jgi:hypothetical protein
VEHLISPLSCAVMTFVLGVAVHSCEPAHADAWTADEVAVARLTVSEASFASSDDARVITWIVAHNAARRGVSIAEYVATVHHRHTRSESRPWLAGLDASMLKPQGWPDHLVLWEGRGVDAWTQRLVDVRRFLAEDAHGCDRAPSTWGGRTIDRDAIARLMARGYEPVRCGDTRNAYFRRGAR